MPADLNLSELRALMGASRAIRAWSTNDEPDVPKSRVLSRYGHPVASFEWEEDAALCVAAVNALPALLDRVERAEAELSAEQVRHKTLQSLQDSHLKDYLAAINRADKAEYERDSLKSKLAEAECAEMLASRNGQELLRAVEENKALALAAEARVAELEAALREAIEGLADVVPYVDRYFVQKHDFNRYEQEARAALAKEGE